VVVVEIVTKSECAVWYLVGTTPRAKTSTAVGMRRNPATEYCRCASSTGLGRADELVAWAGYQWDTQGFGSLTVSNSSLQLQVTSTTNDPWSWGIAHTQPSGLSSYTGPWIQVTFADTSSSGTGGLLAFENPLGSGSLWGEVGTTLESPPLITVCGWTTVAKHNLLLWGSVPTGITR
jgi:hypothetical protein